ncbi:FkbM family methyltransferase [Poriferisphaera sp. WC338]|uniref:FkbM family methyltransferase n=1 Tax=Poriferisphaera sp. WC338 TaxID=3425129 RepID=UPI003D812AFA
MPSQYIKQAYWSCLNALRRWQSPSDVVLSPHDWITAVQAQFTNHDKPIIMVDGGAHDGVFAKKFASQFSNIKIHAFEPNTDLLPELQTNLKNIPGSINTLGLAETTGSQSFNIGASPMTSSMLPPSDIGKTYFNDVIQTEEQRTIHTTSLDDWAAQNNINRIDILKLDLQGYEIPALNGAKNLLKQGIPCVFTEVSFIPFYEGSALFSDVDTLMRAHGYRLLNLYNLATRNNDHQLTGGDALYILDQSNTRIIKRAA